VTFYTPVCSGCFTFACFIRVGNVLFTSELPERKMCFCRSNALIPCSFCDSKINIYIYWLSRLSINHYCEYFECNIWYLALVSHAKFHPFNAHTWKSLPPKSLFVDKYENDTHAHVYPQYDTYVAEFHKKGKSTHRQLQTTDPER
jgi:hypothetical protein